MWWKERRGQYLWRKWRLRKWDPPPLPSYNCRGKKKPIKTWERKSAIRMWGKIKILQQRAISLWAGKDRSQRQSCWGDQQGTNLGHGRESKLCWRGRKGTDWFLCPCYYSAPKQGEISALQLWLTLLFQVELSVVSQTICKAMETWTEILKADLPIFVTLSAIRWELQLPVHFVFHKLTLK